MWHRRAGKDDYALHKTCVAAHPPQNNPMPLQRVANYWHCLPMYEQARKAVWEAINPRTGKKRIDEAFPLELRKRTDNGSMTIEFKIGSIWKMVGSDNPDSLVGAPPFGITFSEWALSNPTAWAYLAPILAENGGWASFITTSRGRNHAYTMHKHALASKEEWFAETLTVDDTGVISHEIVEQARREYHALFGMDAGDALIEQEYYCSFEAAILGAYWGREMVDAEREGRISAAVEYDDALPVYTAWDLGVGDDTAIWLFQVSNGRVRVIDFFQNQGKGAIWYVRELEARAKLYGYRYSWDFVPHDAKAREWASAGPDGDAKTRIQTLIELKRKPRVVPDHTIEDGINATRRLLPRAHFAATEAVERGLECLRQYRREWDDDKKVFRDRPLHDWTSHAADAFRYLAMSVTKVMGAVNSIDTPVAANDELPPPPKGMPTLNDMIAAQAQRERGSRV